MSTSKVNLDQFKALNPIVKQVIKDKLKVDAGYQNINHIIAASQGLNNYHNAKKVADTPYYDARCNLGTDEHPFYVTQDIGHCESIAQAAALAHDLLANSLSCHKWVLYEDGTETSLLLLTQPQQEKGIRYDITLIADDMAGVGAAIDNLKNTVMAMGGRLNEFNHDTPDHQYTFNRCDDEAKRVLSFLNESESSEQSEVNVEPFFNAYAIFDAEGVIESDDNYDELYDLWEDRWSGDSPLEHWEHYLIFGETCSIPELLADIKGEVENEVYHILQSGTGGKASSGVLSSGSAGEVMGFIERYNSEPAIHIFKEKRRD